MPTGITSTDGYSDIKYINPSSDTNTDKIELPRYDKADSATNLSIIYARVRAASNHLGYRQKSNNTHISQFSIFTFLDVKEQNSEILKNNDEICQNY